MRRFFPLLALALSAAAQAPFHRAELIFPLEKWHNHASSIVELPGGELFVCWYHGSGERQADDVVIRGARRPRGKTAWGAPFLLADTPGFPDANPALFLDSRRRLWLFWPVILANEWHTGLLKYRISSDYRGPGAPRWEVSEDALFIPRNFEAAVKRTVAGWPPTEFGRRIVERAGDKYFSRMGWMPRVHPTELPSGRVLLPLYSDGYSFSLVAITDDGGATWTTSEPLVGPGNVQPSIVRRKDGSLVAYMRDNGPPPKRIQVSESRDEGVTWSAVKDSDLPNPGAGIEAIALREGLWALVYNDTEKGRASLAVALSGDEGKTWAWRRHLELDPAGKGSFHYPSIAQGSDGALHVSYSTFVAEGKSIKHAEFNVAWVKAGDPRP